MNRNKIDRNSSRGIVLVFAKPMVNTGDVNVVWTLRCGTPPPPNGVVYIGWSIRTQKIPWIPESVYTLFGMVKLKLRVVTKW